MLVAVCCNVFSNFELSCCVNQYSHGCATKLLLLISPSITIFDDV